MTPAEWFDQFPPNPAMDGHEQWCARHWAPCPSLGANGIGASAEVMRIWLDEIAPKGSYFDPDWDCAFNVAVCRRQDEAEHIASWHPLVASDFAAVLEVAAGELEADHRDGLLVAAAVLKAARTYLGESASADVR